jgi:hypothetical protein
MDCLIVGKTVEAYPNKEKFLLIQGNEVKPFFNDIAALADKIRGLLKFANSLIKNDAQGVLWNDGKAYEYQRLSYNEMHELAQLLNKK